MNVYLFQTNNLTLTCGLRKSDIKSINNQRKLSVSVMHSYRKGPNNWLTHWECPRKKKFNVTSLISGKHRDFVSRCYVNHQKYSKHRKSIIFIFLVQVWFINFLKAHSTRFCCDNKSLRNIVQLIDICEKRCERYKLPAASINMSHISLSNSIPFPQLNIGTRFFFASTKFFLFFFHKFYCMIDLQKTDLNCFIALKIFGKLFNFFHQTLLY